MKVCFETFGCRLNRAEALQQEADYIAKGWEITERHDDADLVVVRGCSVTRRAQIDCEKLIAHIRRKYPTLIVKVVGCLKDPAQSPNVPKKVEETAASVSTEPIPSRTARGFLKVQDGCSRRCSYCIIPSFRGNSVSIPFNDILEKARRLRDEGGYEEIVMTGCNLSLYSYEGKTLPHLIDALSAIGGFRLRLGSIEPGEQAGEIINAMAANENVCKALHLSVQSGSSGILTAMRRPYLAKTVDNLAEKTLSLMPDCSLGCDIITGFPGETQLDFISTKSLLERHLFSNVHIFPFSARPGTPAAVMPGQLSREEKSRRAHELSRIAKKNRYEFAERFLGRTVEVAVEDESRPSGWTSEYLWCTLKTAARNMFPRKSVRKMKVIGVSKGALEAVHADS